MLEGVTLENGTVYVADMKAKLIALNTHIRQQKGFVKNPFTICAQNCVDGFKPRLNDNTLTEACKVQEALHFIAVKLESKLLQMQIDIDKTIYKDDAHVKQELKELLETIDNGFGYFWAASAEQYIEHVEYNLQKLSDKVRHITKQSYWNRNINTYLSGVRQLEKKRKDWSTWKSISEIKEKVEDHMLNFIRPRLVAAMDYINEDTAKWEFAHGYRKSLQGWNSAYHMRNLDNSYVKAEWNTAYNLNLLDRIIEYMDRAITTPGVQPDWTPNPIHVSHFLPGRKKGALLDGEGGGRRDVTFLLQQLLELSV